MRKGHSVMLPSHMRPAPALCLYLHYSLNICIHLQDYDRLADCAAPQASGPSSGLGPIAPAPQVPGAWRSHECHCFPHPCPSTNLAPEVFIFKHGTRLETPVKFGVPDYMFASVSPHPSTSSNKPLGGAVYCDSLTKCLGAPGVRFPYTGTPGMTMIGAVVFLHCPRHHSSAP